MLTIYIIYTYIYIYYLYSQQKKKVCIHTDIYTYIQTHTIQIGTIFLTARVRSVFINAQSIRGKVLVKSRVRNVCMKTQFCQRTSLGVRNVYLKAPFRQGNVW